MSINSQSPVARRIGKSVILVCIALTFFKFWLIRNDEILAYRSPNDAEWYLESASHWYWDRPYEEKASIHLPGFPIWVAVSHNLGVPLRLSSEAIFLLSAFALAAALIKAGQSRFLGVVIFVAFAFSPWSFAVYRRASTDTLYAPLQIVALAGMIRLLVEPDRRARWKLAVLTGLALALLWQTREENQIITISLVTLAGLIFIVARHWQPSWRGRLRDALTAVVIPAVIIFVMSLAVKSINYAAWGLFAADDVSALEFEAANRALLRIKPEHPIRRVPFLRESRWKAYEVSPAFAELQGYLEGPAGKAWESFGKVSGLHEEIGGGMFLWAFREAAASKKHYSSAAESAAFFQRIANEINAACDSGQLPSRRATAAFLDPNAASYWRYFPSTLVTAAKMLVETEEPMPLGDQDYKPPAPTVAVFNEMATRRVPPGGETAIGLLGWAFAPGDRIERIELRGYGQVLAATETNLPRFDIFASHLGIAGVPTNSGFVLSIPRTAQQDQKARLIFKTARHGDVRVPCWVDAKGEIQFGEPVGRGVIYSIDLAKLPQTSHPLEPIIQHAIWSVYGRVVLLLSILAIVAGVGLLWMGKRIDWSHPIYAIFILMMVIAGARIAMFTILDIVAWSCLADPRYLFPIMGIYTAGVLVLVVHAAKTMLTLRHNVAADAIDSRIAEGMKEGVS